MASPKDKSDNKETDGHCCCTVIGMPLNELIKQYCHLKLNIFLRLPAKHESISFILRSPARPIKSLSDPVLYKALVSRCMLYSRWATDHNLDPQKILKADIYPQDHGHRSFQTKQQVLTMKRSPEGFCKKTHQ